MTKSDLLKEHDFSLATTIRKCRAKEAAKQQRVEISDRPQSISALYQSNTRHPTAQLSPVQSMVANLTQQITHSALPTA